MEVNNVTLQKIFPSSPLAVGSCPLHADRSDVHLFPKELDEKLGNVLFHMF